jgi:hypothetical protein
MEFFKKFIDELFDFRYWFTDTNYRTKWNLNCTKKIKYKIYKIK